MTNRQPKGTPVGGQFAEGRKPDGPDLTIQPIKSVDVFGRVTYTVNGKLHREDGPAVVDLGISAYYRNGLLHREDGPAVIRPNGELEWWKNGELVSITPAKPEVTADIDPTNESVRGASISYSDSSEVQAGQVFDTVVVVDRYPYDGEWRTSETQFHRRRPGVFGGTPYAMRIQANRPLDDEMRVMAGLVGYAYRSTVAGESIGQPMRDSPYSFVVSSDTTKTSRDDLGMALEEFEEALPGMIKDGSPIRKTNRAGAGTQGTRLVDGLGPDLKFELYYDDAWIDEGSHLHP